MTTMIEVCLYKSFLVSNNQPEAGGSVEIMDANFVYWVRMAQAKYLSHDSSGEPPAN
jgi:hypothetical protein